MDRLDRVSRKYSLHINVDKTKVMASDDIACRILIQNEQLEQMDTFPIPWVPDYRRWWVYDGCTLTIFCNQGPTTTAFRTRLKEGKAIGASLQKIWKTHSIPISAKIRLTKALVLPAATYGRESWTLRKNEETRLDVLEMKGLRKILQVSSFSWTANKTNEWVLHKAGVKRELLDTVEARKLANNGQVKRGRRSGHHVGPTDVHYGS